MKKIINNVLVNSLLSGSDYLIALTNKVGVTQNCILRDKQLNYRDLSSFVIHSIAEVDEAGSDVVIWDETNGWLKESFTERCDKLLSLVSDEYTKTEVSVFDSVNQKLKENGEPYSFRLNPCTREELIVDDENHPGVHAVIPAAPIDGDIIFIRNNGDDSLVGYAQWVNGSLKDSLVNVITEGEAILKLQQLFEADGAEFKIADVGDEIIDISNIDDGDLICLHCGCSMDINEDGVSHHIDCDGLVNYELDADHVAVAQEN